MEYKIIGDIHGRSNWHEFIENYNSNTTYVFVGDYTDPYPQEKINFKTMMGEIYRMLKFKQEHPNNVIILIGNHDFQYIYPKDKTNRLDVKNYQELTALFEDYKDFFDGITYQIGEKYLITHAGVTKEWYNKYIGEYNESETTLQEVCDNINELWAKNKDAFTFAANASYGDYFGETATHGPLWVRPETLFEHNLFGYNTNFVQVVGHTRFYGRYSNSYDNKIAKLSPQKLPNGDIFMGENLLKAKPTIILIDCLDKYSSYLLIKEDNSSKIINRHEKVNK